MGGFSSGGDCHTSLSPSFLWSGTLAALPHPTPKVPEWDKTTAKARAGQWGLCCVWMHTQPYTSCSGSSLVALGAMAGPGAWVWGGQGCWPELAWRSHSSPGKAENRQPLCPGVLLQPRSLSLCSPLLLLPPLFSLLSLLVPFHLLHPLPSSLRIPEGPCHLLPSISPLPLSEAQIPSLPFLFFILSHPAPSLWPVRSHLFSC